jgi:hypothetical protein
MKNMTTLNNRLTRRMIILALLSVMIIINIPVTLCAQGLYIVNNTPSTCGAATGEVIFGVNPTPSPNQLVVYDVYKVSPDPGYVVGGPFTITPAYYTLPNLSFGNYIIETDQGTLHFTVLDDALWPYQAQVPSNGSPGTRAFTKDLKVDDEHNVYAAGAYNGIITFSNTYTGTIFEGFYIKLDQCGNVIWDKVISGSSHVESININANFVTSDQELIMCGDWSVGNSNGSSETLYLNGQTLTVNGDGKYGFIGKWSISTGSCQWVAGVRGPDLQLKVKDICADGDGNIFVLGDFETTSVDCQLEDLGTQSYVSLTTIGPNNDVFIAAYSSNGALIDAQTDFISSPWYDDFAGGLCAVRSHYPTSLFVGGDVTEIITTGQGGIIQPSQGLSCQRWILDNTSPKTLRRVSLFDIIPQGQSVPAGSQEHFGLCVDYLPIDNEYMFVISGLVRVPNSNASRPFIFSFHEPINWTSPPNLAEQTWDVLDFINNNQNQNSYNVASNVAIDQYYGSIKISGVQYEYGVQQHPYQSANPFWVGGNSNYGYLFIDNFIPDVANYEIDDITGSTYSVYNNTLSQIITDFSPEVFNWGYGALTCDVNSQYFYAGNFSYSQEFTPGSSWGTVYNTGTRGPFFIARFIDDISGQPQFKNLPAINQALTITQKDIHFKLSPNPAVEKTYIYYQNRDITVNIVEIFESTGRLLIKLDNFEGIYPQKIDLSNLSKGVYLVKLIASSSVETKKLIVQ